MSKIALFNEFLQVRNKKKSLMTFQLPHPYRNIRFALKLVISFLFACFCEHLHGCYVLEGAEEVLCFCNLFSQPLWQIVAILMVPINYNNQQNVSIIR